MVIVKFVERDHQNLVPDRAGIIACIGTCLKEHKFIINAKPTITHVKWLCYDFCPILFDDFDVKHGDNFVTLHETFCGDLIAKNLIQRDTINRIFTYLTGCQAGNPAFFAYRRRMDKYKDPFYYLLAVCDNKGEQLIIFGVDLANNHPANLMISIL